MPARLNTVLPKFRADNAGAAGAIKSRNCAAVLSLISHSLSTFIAPFVSICARRRKVVRLAASKLREAASNRCRSVGLSSAMAPEAAGSITVMACSALAA